ncbi:hypothetical protein IGX29_00585 [Streptomyces sp. H28]|uniref:alpha-amylase family glycosyl hydrolase n=1 Tax=Streptomyces sp. H28 TaxID=2775865 RepID=UPI001781C477|nr:alpha-amylase family glycosyl hydrolase [Streptomyces sp. H28]MBD9730335.1 hypothetical protein [Streptomyces sp. H28]
MIYQVYVRSFLDSTGDGIGDLAGVRTGLPYLKKLGVDGIWLSPFYPSPQHDHGYDVADYCGVDPVFGDLDEFDRLIGTARRLGIKVLLDIVPNHCSSEHPWFRQALAAAPGSPERARFHFADGRGPDGDEPPNNWHAMFGGPAWTRVTEPDGRPGQWYLHMFTPEQPDWNWRDPEVAAEFDRTLRFWLDRGVDGFRIDVAAGLFKHPELPDSPDPEADARTRDSVNPLAWNQPEVHDVWRHWRAVCEEYTARDGRERLLVGEVSVPSAREHAKYVRPDELHQAFFFDLQAVNSGANRPRGVEPRQVRRVAVLGAGMMGAGIAYSCARAGIDVVLKDVSLDAAVKGKGYSERLCEKAVAKGRTTREKADALLARITPTAEAADLAGCDAVIEAVFEDTGLKHKVFQEVQDVVAPDALLCSNTSTLPITALAEGVERQDDFIGLHFFSPVDKMPLVEIIKGERTGEEALARAFDLVRQIRKTPIVVNDSRGFFTSRVIGHFINEGVAMVGEGVEPASVEQAAAQAGYPAKVLSLVDELTLTLPRRIRQESRRAVEEAGGTWTPHPAEAVMDRMVDEFGRTGRSGGAGFYEYGEDGRRGALWPGLREHFTRPGHEIPFRDMQERMLFAEALDTVRLLEEGVLTSVADANIGSILGIGFPGWTGGVLQYINGYEGGLPGFVARARELADRYGERFTPPALLVEKAERGEVFTDAR